MGFRDISKILNVKIYISAQFGRLNSNAIFFDCQIAGVHD